MAAPSLRFTVEVAADKATEQIKAISTAVNQAGFEINRSFLAMSGGANAAKEAHKGLESSVKALKGEMVGAQRTVNFFARALNDVIPASSMAGEGIRLLGSALIGGFGLGLAIEGVLVGVKLLAEHFKEAEKTAKEFAERGLKSVEESAKRVEAAIGGVRIGDPKKLNPVNVARAQIAEMEKELRGILKDRPVEPGELAKAKSALTLSLPGQWETMAAVAGTLRSIVTYGLDDLYYDTYPAKVRALTLDQIPAAAAEVVHPDELVWVIVGDLSKIEAGVRELNLGEVKVIPAS